MGEKLLKIRFVYDQKNPKYWLDGLWAALKVLENDFEIEWLNIAHKYDPIESVDFTLGWGGFGSPVDEYMEYVDGKKGLCIGGNVNQLTRTKYDVLFYETDWVKDALSLETYECLLFKAFGVNTEIYAPIDINVPIVWDYIGVGAFASWKRWDRMLNKQGNRLVIGEYQEQNEQESLGIVQSLVRGGVMVSGMVHPFDLANLYHWSRTLYIPADIYGGGERAILEARSCGLKVEIEEDNPKLKQLLDCPVPTYKEYAQKLKEGILYVNSESGLRN